VNTLGTHAQDRHRAMEEGYRKALEEYFNIIESYQPSAVYSKSQTIENLKTLLERIIPKRKTDTWQPSIQEPELPCKRT